MSHHSHNPLDRHGDDVFKRILAERTPLHDAMRQVFGEYPDGKLNNNDAGAMAMQVGVMDGRVVMHFGKPVHWIGFTGDEALRLAQSLIAHAKSAGIKTTFQLEI